LAILLAFLSLRAEAGIVFEDDFTGGVGNWTILHNDASYYSTSESGLDLKTCAGDMWAGQTDYKNLFTIATPPAGALAGDFTVTMKLSFNPTAGTWPQINLIAYDNDDNWVRANYMRYNNVNASFQLAKEEAATPSEIGHVVNNLGDATFWLRLTKTNHDATATYKQYYSTNGTDFTIVNGESGTDFGDGSLAYVGFVAMVDDSPGGNHAYISSFQLDGVPEPSVSMLGLMGFGALAGLRRFKRNQ